MILLRHTLASCLALAAALHASADLMPPKSREPQFPPKTQRMLWTDGEVAVARENIAKYPAAKAIAEATVKRADVWMAWDDAALRAIVTDGGRAARVYDATAGCPQCA